MLIQHKTVGTKGTFFVESDGRNVAEMVYTMSTPDRMMIEHTEVDESLKGKHVGSDLVARGVEFAREQQIRIVPLCSFARAIFKKTPEYQDVLA